MIPRFAWERVGGALVLVVFIASCSADRPRDFGILIESGDRIDTFEGRVTKDLVASGDTTIALELSGAQMDTLYQAVRSLRVLDLPEPHPAATQHFMQPVIPSHVRIRAHGRTRDFRWDSNLRPAAKGAEEWKRLRTVMDMTKQMVQRDSGYRALPRPTGGYW